MLTRLGALALLLFTLVLSLVLGYPLEPSPPSTITLALMGDVMLGRGVALAHQDGSWQAALADLAPILRTADLVLANLESPLAQPVPGHVAQALAAGEYNLCAPGESAGALTAAGLNVLSLANNHALDCGPGGLEATAGLLEKAGLTPLLSNQTRFITLRGQALALLAFDDINAPLDLDAAAAQVRAARERAPLVVVSLHWGAEYHSAPNLRQQAVARALTDAGALLIWGHHPHVLQQVVWQREGHHGPPFESSVLVAYSLGNTLFDQFSPPDVRRAAVLLVTLDENGVQAVRVVPIWIDPLAGVTHLADQDVVEAVLRRLGLE